MSRILMYDDRGGFSPSFVRSHATGGSEMHQNQLASFLVQSGHEVHAFHRGPDSEEDGVLYRDSSAQHPSEEYDTLIVIGCASIPTSYKWERMLAFQVVDPRPQAHMFDHLLGRATMVCVSEWQATLFRALGHSAVVIPVPMPEEWYTRDYFPQYDFVCVSSWNKGARETIDAWDTSWGSLAVGSPYSHPDDAEAICRAKGVTWLGALRPRERWAAALHSGHAVARVCTIGETFGVTDVAARAMGKCCYTLCTGDVGALREVGARPFTDPAEWREAIRQRAPHPGGDAEAYRSKRVLSRWLELLA